MEKTAKLHLYASADELERLLREKIDEILWRDGRRMLGLQLGALLGGAVVGGVPVGQSARAPPLALRASGSSQRSAVMRTNATKVCL